jgi:periplasmic divalent cation tolerance protein
LTGNSLQLSAYRLQLRTTDEDRHSDNNRKKGNPMTTIYLVYITTGDKAEARHIGMALVESKLAACVNIIDHMNSMYRWEGKIQEDQEVILIAKTTEKNIPALKKKVKAMHSYDCPCMVCLPVAQGYGPFLEWIQKQVIR